MWQRFTERARRVVFFAQEEAARLGENYVGTEHLLLGLVRESDSVAARILEDMGIPLGRLRSDIERQVTRGHGNLGQDMQLTPRSKRVIDLAHEEARELNNNYIGTEHVLLGLIREGDGLAARVLVKQGVDFVRAKQVVRQMQEAAPPAEEARDRPTFETDAIGWLRALVADRPNLPENVRRVGSVHHALSVARQVCSEVNHLLAIADLKPEQAEALLGLALVLKASRAAGVPHLEDLLRGQSLALIFEKPSLRTRVTFEAGIFQLGGQAIHLGAGDIGLGKRESAADVARNLERWVDGIAARTFQHQTVLDLAANTQKIPVINALSDHEHPCQALADMLTLMEKFGKLEGLHLAYVGDGNNVAHSLALLAPKVGVNLSLACPAGYEPAPAVMEAAQEEAGARGSSIRLLADPREAVRDADAVYTDVWTSMGQEAEAAERVRVFQPYQVNAELVRLAKPEAVVMHCLPAHRGEEITDEVMDGPQSVVFDQSENRLHAQKAVLAVLM